MAARDTFCTLLEGRRGGMGLALVSVDGEVSGSSPVGEVESRCAGFLATGGGPLAVFCEGAGTVFCDDAEIVEADRGGGGTGACFLT